VSVTTENYLKQIFAASERSPDEIVGLGELAHALAVTPGTVTTMMKNLSAAGLVEYRPRRGVRLTEEGREEALRVVRRHRLIELFLVETLGLDWADVHDEAEVLEHAMSDRLLERIDELLGHPDRDPHGDPIPDPDGRLPRRVGIPLAEAPAPANYRVARVEHDESAFLGFLQGTGLTPGAEFTLVERTAAAGTLTVAVANRRSALSIQAARKIRVERLYSEADGSSS
jgi:DtxR family Mn-dependent transcriptional regulator